MSHTINVICASAPIDETELLTLKLDCSLWTQPKRWVQGWAQDGGSGSVELGESGIMHEYEPAAVNMQLPSRTEQGSQDLKFSIQTLDGSGISVIRDVVNAIASNADKRVTATVSRYMSSNLSAPVESFRMTAKSATGSVEKGITVGCAFHDLTNKAFPAGENSRYTADNAPGLIWI
ncbi:MAG: DUF1833 domain-containing protein [Saccharospirillaceae bacterium]|nr:DUF1833 domain-containing protein [Saccharospirillaceae bacterium]